MITEIGEFGQHTLIATETKVLEIVINDDQHIFVIRDLSIDTQDWGIRVWFSKDKFWNPEIFEQFFYKKEVALRRPLYVSLKNENIHQSISLEIDGQTIAVPNGTYYLNIQNLTGAEKKFFIDKIENT